MPDRNAVFENGAPSMLNALRIVTALLFLRHGAQKALKLVGGALLALGLFTRPVAFAAPTPA